MTPQALFNRCAYLMLSEGATPRDVWEGANVAVPAGPDLRALQRDLQRVHDDYAPEAWPKQLARVARAYQLESP